jgi:threonine dehydratase
LLDTLTIESIREARERIAPYVLRTPTLHYRMDGAELFLKAESLQATGAFKLRGAFNLMATLDAGTGVVAHSSGNHAQAVARAAAVLGLHAVIVMPSDAPAIKRQRAAADGAEIIVVGPDSEERAALAEKLAGERGWVPVPPFDDPRIAAGQGTAALELLEDAGEIERFYAPVSGGGLMAGSAVAVHALQPAVEIVAVEPADANSLQLSLTAGTRRSVPAPHTIADGLRVRTPGALTWPVLQRHVARVVLVSDDAILQAMAFALRELRLVLEPSGAAALAAALDEGRGRCGVMLTGGNATPELLAHVTKLARTSGSRSILEP